MRFGGGWTPQSSSENMTGCLGIRTDTVKNLFSTCVPLNGVILQRLNGLKSKEFLEAGLLPKKVATSPDDLYSSLFVIFPAGN